MAVFRVVQYPTAKEATIGQPAVSEVLRGHEVITNKVTMDLLKISGGLAFVGPEVVTQLLS